ncbi:MAG: carbon storage regulator [Ferrimicrobium sp.]
MGWTEDHPGGTGHAQVSTYQTLETTMTTAWSITPNWVGRLNQLRFNFHIHVGQPPDARVYPNGIETEVQTLVFRRKASESLVLGDEITITVVEVGPGSVRIGIEASLAFRVWRRQE